jgi:hypothetical protein
MNLSTVSHCNSISDGRVIISTAYNTSILNIGILANKDTAATSCIINVFVLCQPFFFGHGLPIVKFFFRSPTGHITIVSPQHCTIENRRTCPDVHRADERSARREVRYIIADNWSSPSKEWHLGSMA